MQRERSRIRLFVIHVKGFVHAGAAHEFPQEPDAPVARERPAAVILRNQLIAVIMIEIRVLIEDRPTLEPQHPIRIGPEIIVIDARRTIGRIQRVLRVVAKGQTVRHSRRLDQIAVRIVARRLTVDRRVLVQAVRDVII